MKDMNDQFNICFISGKLGDVDGVSLETDKWISVLSGMGHRLFTVAGLYTSELLYVPQDHQLTIEAISFSSPRQEYYENLVFPYLSKRPPHLSEKKLLLLEEELIREGREIAAVIYQFIQVQKIDLIIAENTNAMPMTLLGAVAVNELIQVYSVAALFHHHDFWWERSRFSESCIDQLLNRIMPPKNLSVEHVVISSYAEHILSSVKRVKPHIIPNCEDFEHPPVMDDYNSHFREDLGFSDEDILIVQPTRIVPRKRIEDSIRLVGKFCRKYTQLADRVHFIISLYHGDELESTYLKDIIGIAERYGVRLRMISDRVSSQRAVRDGKRCYTNRDVLTNADLITFLPVWEGFGNALLETIAAKIPLVTTTYLVYKTDIKMCGVQPIEIRDHYDRHGRLIIADSVLDEIYEVLTHKNIRTLRVNLSFKAASDEFSMDILKSRLSEILENYADEIRASRRRVLKSQQSYYV
ncbi:glycosyltransferase family 4 protein [Oceanispirochaeta sp.]|jgi:glycosyltransferase involved in cell wall biosynthesis|uniref:glycosyltransferase family 4 protein n=1 Tax=Oceanispirochaeta sp. TaxID=2035350 RepID=UPI00262621EC|nr:glycosyltransferase family 4 protein [Oceanispirochaeta sp.]MDA3955456.1 glycosyltransferase family 4 protein [Oceanispirochaeta sp.]